MNEVVGEVKDVQKGRLVGKVTVPRGEIVVYTKGLEFSTEMVMSPNGDEGWLPFKGFIPITNWLGLYEIGMHLLYKDYQNPGFLIQYFSIDDELAEMMSDLYDADIREDLVKKIKDKAVEEAESLIRKYDKLRRIREASGSQTLEFYNAKREEFVAYMLVTDSESKRRSRFAMNDITLNLFLTFIRNNLYGVVSITDKSGESIYVMKERESYKAGNEIKERYVYKLGNSKGDMYRLTVADRIRLSYCLEKFFTTKEVRPIITEKFRLFNSEKTKKPVLGVGKILAPLHRDIYKIYGLISSCVY